MNNSEFFPYGASLETNAKNASYSLPATVLFGNRFFIDQPIIELLCEFMQVMIADKNFKNINGNGMNSSEYFPHVDDKYMFNVEYEIDHRINFKLFSLWNSGKTTKASEGHYQRYHEIREQLLSRFVYESRDSIERHMDILSNLYQGFQTSGAERDWCARSFLPISKNMLTGETIWRASRALEKSGNIDNFDDNKSCFRHKDRNFYARGGEILYMQLMAVFSKSKNDVEKLLKEDPRFKNIRIRNEQEKDPEYLRKSINKGFESFFDDSALPSAFNEFMDFIEDFYPEEKKEPFNRTSNMNIGFIPQETWYLGYLFALELSRLFLSHFGQVELINLLKIECCFQTMRTMLFQSAACLKEPIPSIAVVSPYCKERKFKDASINSKANCLNIIKNAFLYKLNNDPRIVKQFTESDDKKKIHEKSGYKLFNNYGKQIGLIIPKTGGGEHFVLTKDMLILLVSTTMSPGESLTYDSFLNDIRVRFGFVFDEEGFTSANAEAGQRNRIIDSEIDEWLISMLEECGYWIALSDALSLVKNTNLGVVE